MTQISFLIISIFALVLFYLGIGKDKKVFLLFFMWQIVLGSISFLGIFQKKPLLLPIVILLTVLFSVFLLSKTYKSSLNTKFLLWIHILRIPVELILYQLFLQKKLPQLMTFDGWNFDILIGLSALIASIYLLITKNDIPPKLFRVWNFLGLIFLGFIVSLALLSSPLPIQQLGFEQPNIAVLEFPFSLLPTCVVPIVFMSHILLIRLTKKTLTGKKL